MKAPLQLFSLSTLPLTPIHASPTPDLLEVSPSTILAAIKSFPNGSAGSPDKLTPQHLKDLVQGLDTSDESPFLSALSDFAA